MFVCITKTEKSCHFWKHSHYIQKPQRLSWNPPGPSLPSAAATSSSAVWWTSLETFFYTYTLTHSRRCSFVCYAFVCAYYIKCYHRPANCFFPPHTLLAIYVDTLGATTVFSIVGLCWAVMLWLCYHFPCCGVFRLRVVFLPPRTQLQWTPWTHFVFPLEMVSKAGHRVGNLFFQFFLWQMLNYHTSLYSHQQSTGVPVPTSSSKYAIITHFILRQSGGWKMSSIQFYQNKENFWSG